MSEAAREPFGTRLAGAMDRFGPLCVGIDPHPQLLHDWGLTDDIRGLRTFGFTVVDAMAGVVAAVKPQVAFFERFGSPGLAVLEEIIARSRAAQLLCIADAKRGDIGSTMVGYARAFCSDESPLAADAVTLSPYLGYGSLRPAIEQSAATGRGVFVLALTSNAEGAELQHARTAQAHTVAGTIATGAAADNAAARAGGAPLGSVGLVVGATVGSGIASADLDLLSVHGPLLAPGIGAQGATPADLPLTFGSASRQVLASASRSVLAAGPEPARLTQAASDLAASLATATGRG